jgi:hypothetical protein
LEFLSGDDTAIRRKPEGHATQDIVPQDELVAQDGTEVECQDRKQEPGPVGM